MFPSFFLTKIKEMYRLIRRVLGILSVTIAIPFYGCDLMEEMIDYSPYDVDVKGERNINAKNIARIEKACMGKDTIRFVFIGDTQRWYDETNYFVKALNKRTDIDFVIHGGDLSDFGVTDEFMWQRNILSALKVPYVVIIGNHDALGNGNEAFNVIFGETDFSFIAGKVKFICLNTNALEYDYSVPIPNFNFIKRQITDSMSYEQSVVCMHSRPFSDQFNNNVASVFEKYITMFKDLQFCVNAHGHSLETDDLFNDGVIYYECAAINERNYLLFTITPNGYTYEVVYF